MAGRRSKEYDPRHRTKSVTSTGGPRQSNLSYISTDSYFIHDVTSDEKILHVVRCTVLACSLIAAIVAVILDMTDKRWYFQGFRQTVLYRFAVPKNYNDSSS